MSSLAMDGHIYLHTHICSLDLGSILEGDVVSEHEWSRCEDDVLPLIKPSEHLQWCKCV